MFVVRTDISLKPAWLKASRDSYAYHGYIDTDDETEAAVFPERDEAERHASLWSDVPGVWQVIEKR
jgi:hypothetical protein